MHGGRGYRLVRKVITTPYTMNNLEKFTAQFPASKERYPVAKYTSFKIGGQARIFLECKSQQEFKDAVTLCMREDIPFFILGGGSNVLVSDKGFDGVVLRMTMNQINWYDEIAEAESGVVLAAFSMLAISRGLGGLEAASTIPGTVGGAVRGNAGAFGWETKDSLLSVRVCDPVSGEIKDFSRDECAFGYRDSMFKHGPLIVLSATYKFVPGDKDELFRRAKFYQDKKGSSQPMEYPNSGCVFKNTPLEHVDRSLLACNDFDISRFAQGPVIPSAWVIDTLGLKGKTIGKAQISEKHGNFIINKGGATADEVIQLISFIKQQVRDRTGIELHEEIQLVGF